MHGWYSLAGKAFVLSLWCLKSEDQILASAQTIFTSSDYWVKCNLGGTIEKRRYHGNFCTALHMVVITRIKYHDIWQCWICFMQPTHKIWALWLNFRCKCTIFYQDMIVQKCTYVIKLHMEMTYWKQCYMSKLLRWTSNLKQKFSLQKKCKSRLLQSYRTIEKILCILALTVNPFVFAIKCWKQIYFMDYIATQICFILTKGSQLLA